MAPPDAVDPRLARLRRMQAMATGLLVVMAAVFVGASLTLRLSPAMAYVRAFAEAAMVGGLADWFAVTALFRRPLGLPIPHTAIVPRSKDRIGEALGVFIVDNFLSARVLDARLRQFELAAWGGDWLQKPENARQVAGQLLKWAPEIYRVLPPSAVEELGGAVALSVARSIPAAPTASRLLATLWSEGRVQPLIERGTEILAAYVAEHEEVILKAVQAQSWRWLPRWVDKAITQKITAGVLNLLTEMREPGHPWRQSLAGAVEALIARLASDPELIARGEAFKQQMLDNPRLGEQAHRLWLDLQSQWETGWTAQAEALEPRLAQGLIDLGAWLRDAPTFQRTLNTSARVLVRTVLAPRRHAIGRFVTQVVAGWDAKDVTDRLELSLGPDLQYIRVNGTLVGGLVGLGLFSLSRLFGWG